MKFSDQVKHLRMKLVLRQEALASSAYPSQRSVVGNRMIESRSLPQSASSITSAKEIAFVLIKKAEIRINLIKKGWSTMLSKHIAKNRNGQYRISSLLLLLFSTPFIVWQMGVLYFSGTTMSLFGRTPIPLSDANTMLVIAAGYMTSILLICLFPRKTVWMERVALPVALAATISMLLPMSPNTITLLFYIAAFCCVFSIGVMMSVAAQHFTVETTWRDGIISMVIGGILIAVLQNDIAKVDFTAFTIFSILLIAVQLVFYYLIPARIEATYVSEENRVKMPKIAFIGIWLISGFATLLICFASSFAESVPGGVSAIYLSAAVTAVLLFLLRSRFGKNSVRIFGAFFALSVFGFVLAFLSLHIPKLRLPACILLGFVVTLSNLWIFFAAASFRLYPTRFIGAIGAAMGLMLAMFHSGLQDAFRDNISLLYGIYAALSVALLLIYFFMEPYFTRMWCNDRESPALPGNHGSPAVDAQLAQADRHPFHALSEQERILAELILDGHTETSCAKAMNITLNTQKGYRKNLYLKLDIHSKRELFALAAKRQ